jgi:orotate phosphoribosyltransferase
MSTLNDNNSMFINKKQKLFQIILKHGLINTDGVRLSSGGTSDIYYDIKKIMSYGDWLNDIAYCVHKNSDRALKEIGSVGGMEIASIPIAATIAQRCHMHWFVVRKEQKKHGLQKRIEGEVIDPVWIVDDVLTTGKNIIETIHALNETGHYDMAGITVVVDREDENNRLKEMGIKYNTLFKHSDFINVQ